MGISRLPWTLWLALRFLLSPKRERWTGVISTIALVGVTINVAALTTVNAVMTGFTKIVSQKILSLNPHLTITYHEEDYLKIMRMIKEVVPEKELINLQEVALLQGLLSKKASSAGVIIKGVDVEVVSKEVAFRSFRYEKNSPAGVFPIIVGERLRQKFGLTLGEELNLLTTKGILTPFGFFPKVYAVKVVGFFESGIFDYDLNLVYTPLRSLQERIQTREKIVEIKLRDPFKSSFYKEKLNRTLALVGSVLDWQELNRNLFAALKLEKFGLFVVLSLMVGVSLFTVISAMVMLVSEKKLDIGILRALGARRIDIQRLFFFCGFFLSLFGITGGIVLGSLLCLFLSRYPVIKLPEEVYPVEYLPIKVEVFDLMIITVTALTLGILAILYPAKRASKLNPAEILRKEG